jgi:hypothetical protein
MQKIIGKMARMYPLMIIMGVMIVAIAFIILANSCGIFRREQIGS